MVICNDNQSVPTFLFVGEMINFDLMSIILSLPSFFEFSELFETLKKERENFSSYF